MRGQGYHAASSVAAQLEFDGFRSREINTSCITVWPRPADIGTFLAPTNFAELHFAELANACITSRGFVVADVLQSRFIMFKLCFLFLVDLFVVIGSCHCKDWDSGMSEPTRQI